MLEQAFIVIFGAAVRPDGSPSGAMRDRVGAAVRFGRRLLPQPIYIVTGGQGRYGPPEAQVMAQLLLDRGVSPDYIVLEPTAKNTVRSCIAVAGLLRDVSGPVYAASSAYHLPRCVLLLGLAGLDAHRAPPSIGPASSQVLRRWYWRLREIPAIPVDAVVMIWNRWRGFPQAEDTDPGDTLGDISGEDAGYDSEPDPGLPPSGAMAAAIAGELPPPEDVDGPDQAKVSPMSVFGTIMSKIFGHPAAAAPTAQSEGAPATAPDGTASPTIATSGATPAPAQSVDVSAVLTDLAAKSGQPSNWRTSIVDLMKLLNLDSSLENRKELAQELHYTGDTNDSATMNVWLHKQVMTKLAENGGNVPADLKG